MDKRVEIHGTSRADMNGKRGVATDFHFDKDDKSKWRYTVQLDSGEAFKVKPANLHATDLRFNVGDRVECYIGQRWSSGRVVGLWWRCEEWGAFRSDAPYQVPTSITIDCDDRNPRWYSPNGYCYFTYRNTPSRTNVGHNSATPGAT